MAAITAPAFEVVFSQVVPGAVHSKQNYLNVQTQTSYAVKKKKSAHNVFFVANVRYLTSKQPTTRSAETSSKVTEPFRSLQAHSFLTRITGPFKGTIFFPVS